MNHTAYAVHKHSRPMPLMFLLAFFLVFIPRILMPYIWIDVREVSVTDDLMVSVDRTIHRDFLGSYSVTLREVGGTVVCIGAPDAPFTYKASAEMHGDVTLAWWLGGTKVMDHCEVEGFPKAGASYYITTCHFVMLPAWLPIAGRCVDSNTFTFIRGDA